VFGAEEEGAPAAHGDPVVPRLRVGFDGRALSSPAAGVRRYASALLPSLIALADLDIIVLGGDPGRVPRGAAHVGESRHPPTNLGWALVGLPRAARRGRIDVLHAPAYTAPLWGVPPIVLTVHDVSYARRPEWYPYRRDFARRAFYRRSARAARVVVTDSEFSAAEIVAAYAIPRESIVVAPLGVGERFTPGGPGGAQSAGVGSGGACELPQEISGPFVLHVGDLHERRNLATVVEAVLGARRHFGGAAAVSLVLAGIDRGVGDAICAIAANAGVPEAVVKLGAVSEDLLVSLYRCATALVYPSLYEGFGLPVLEAMACGTPVIASRAASIPEVAGDAGILLDPLDAAAWTDAIVNVVNDDNRRAEMRTRGLARAAEFTWARTAELTAAAYRAAVGQRSKVKGQK
jgi:glycosyltransferase involved in cell wall biosynthesis